MAQSDLSDDTYGITDPDDLLEQQAMAYQKAQQNPNATVRNVSSGLYGIQSMFGGGPQVNQSRRVQAQMQSILQDVNSGSDPNEDPLTKQYRTAQAISQGMMSISPTIALRAQDQAVRLAQAQKQQQLLGLQTQEAEESLKQAQFKGTIQRNTPQTISLVQDQGKDSNGIPLGYEATHTYDLTDPASLAQIRADMQTAKENGQTLIPMTSEQLANSKVQAAAMSAQARAYAAQQSAQAREQAALTSLQKGQSNAINDRFTNRVMAGADLGIGAAESIAGMPFGTSRGLMVDGQFAHPGTSLWNLTGQNLRNALTTTDSQLYNTFTAGLSNNLAAVETQGLGQGLQQLAARLQDKIQFKPGDSAITVMGKMAEVRDTLDRGLAITMADQKVDPSKKQEMQDMLERLHTAIPFTRNDVVAFDRMSQENPEMSFTDWSKQHNVPGAQSQISQPQAPSGAATRGVDNNGKPGITYGN